MVALNIQRDKLSFSSVRVSSLFGLASLSECRLSGSSLLTASSSNPNIQVSVSINAISLSFHLEKW